MYACKSSVKKTYAKNIHDPKVKTEECYMFIICMYAVCTCTFVNINTTHCLITRIRTMVNMSLFLFVHVRI